jgi:nitroreductase
MVAVRTVGMPGGCDALAARFVVRAATATPSVHNTQPWYFVSRPGLIRLYADPSRQLRCADPAGREMVISCGAALFNMRLAVRQLGFAAKVRLLPDVSQRALLAEIHWGWYAPPTLEEQVLYRSIMRRYTHRGPFTGEASPLLVANLVPAARQGHAQLHVLFGPEEHQLLGQLIRAAELTQRGNCRFAAETARWVGLPGQARRDGVPMAACPRQPDGLEFATRGFTRDPRHGFTVRADRGNPHALGAVALLSTPDDSRPSWLCAGQALQRLLLQATADGIGAAFHTQPLELPGLRERIRAQFTGGKHPQMLLRLGCGGRKLTTPRRPVSETLRTAA